MGRLIVEQIVTADGFAADPEGGIDFIDESYSDDQGIDAEQLEMLRGVDAIVFGATTYRMFADYWPTASVELYPVAEPINRLPKHVISNTLDRAPWGDGEIDVESGDGVESVRRLLNHYSGGVIVWGSLTLTDALFAAGLVDVLRLRVVPHLIGSGRGTTPSGLAPTGLKLTAVHPAQGGKVTLEYALTPLPATAG